MIVHFLDGHMKAYLRVTQNLVDVQDVASGHVLALERARPGSRFVLGGDDLRMEEILQVLSELTGIPAPRTALPRSLLKGMAHVNEWISRHVTGREPLVPLEAILHAEDARRASSRRAVEELGFEARPAREVLARAVRWFVANGHGGARLAARLGAQPEI
jgi:dihydroflavonol-4-reductase